MEDFKRIYKKHKQKIIPAIISLAAVFLFLQVTLPLLTNIQESQALIADKEQEVEVKENAILILNSIPDATVDNNYELVTTALPTAKDIVLIFSQLETISERVGVSLGGFTVKVGGVYEATAVAEKVKPNSKAKPNTSMPYINIAVNVEGENTALRQFAEEMYKSLPLVEINSINISKDDARYDMDFYYKIAPTTLTSVTTPLKKMTPAEEKQIEMLREWNIAGINSSQF